MRPDWSLGRLPRTSVLEVDSPASDSLASDSSAGWSTGGGPTGGVHVGGLICE